MSESDSESSSEVGISDEQLPDDLVPSEDNPLAEGLDPDEMPDDLDLGEGKHADESDESEESAG